MSGAAKCFKVYRSCRPSPEGWCLGDRMVIEIDGARLSAYATKIEDGKLLEAWAPDEDLHLRFVAQKGQT